MRLTVLDSHQPGQVFPPPHKALTEPDGLLAIGGCLSKERLLTAYRHGIFPWYNKGEPILWWSPNPRLALAPENLIISRSLHKTLRKNTFTVTFDHAFTEVITACAEPRKEGTGTWITEDIAQAYNALHKSGYAHSVEAWLDGQLVGGLYGIALGRVFFGESMFHIKTDASKVVFASLVKQLEAWNYQLIDCQVHTAHLAKFGAINYDRNHFIELLNQYCDLPPDSSAWQSQ